MTGLQGQTHSSPAKRQPDQAEGDLFRLKDEESLFRVMVRTAWVGFLGEMANGLESMRERANSRREIYRSDE